MKYYCIESNCNKEVSEKNRRCRSCSKKGNLNPGFGKHKLNCKCPFCKSKREDCIGKVSPNYKNGTYSDNKPKCIIENCANIVIHKGNMCKSHSNQLKNLGEKSHFWKGGITVLKDLIKNLKEYKVWRTQVFERDDYRCQECFVRGGDLEAHHIKEFNVLVQEFLQTYSQFSPIEDKETLLRLAISYALFWELDNGKTLCEKCHKKTDSYGYKYYHRRNK